MVYEVFSVTDREFEGLNCDMELLSRIALELCNGYYSQGFRSVYGIHWDKGEKAAYPFCRKCSQVILLS
ncbi:hypothetical protein D7V86_25340 [bacterium D16-51]|nr:hypothetical protein D7V96_24860 [bacterium D16-59]RKI53126.1 hypothetical protein D7V86_25340 [bacterium D16-51]